MAMNERRRKVHKPPQNKTGQEVVYTSPKPFQRNRLILQLLTIAAVVVAVLLSISLFFKVDETKIQISGNEQYTAWEILQASGLEGGENLLTFSQAGAAGRIVLGLDYIESVRIGIKLPDTVLIEVKEIQVTYAVKDTADEWWLISAGGKVVKKAEGGEEESATKLLGIRIADPVEGHKAVADQDQQNVDEQGNPIPVIHTNAERLRVALEILQYLELKGILGQAASVDVNNMGDIQLWYKEQYQVKLGDSSRMGEKISMMAQMISQMDDYQSGVLDLTFTTYPNQGGYRPFD